MCSIMWEYIGLMGEGLGWVRVGVGGCGRGGESGYRGMGVKMGVLGEVFREYLYGYYTRIGAYSIGL